VKEEPWSVGLGAPEPAPQVVGAALVGLWLASSFERRLLGGFVCLFLSVLIEVLSTGLKGGNGRIISLLF